MLLEIPKRAHFRQDGVVPLSQPPLRSSSEFQPPVASQGLQLFLLSSVSVSHSFAKLSPSHKPHTQPLSSLHPRRATITNHCILFLTQFALLIGRCFLFSFHANRFPSPSLLRAERSLNLLGDV